MIETGMVRRNKTGRRIWLARHVTIAIALPMHPILRAFKDRKPLHWRGACRRKNAIGVENAEWPHCPKKSNQTAQPQGFGKNQCGPIEQRERTPTVQVK